MKRRKPNSLSIYFVIGGGLLLLIVAAIMLATQNASSSPTPATAFEEEAYLEIPRVSLADAKAAFDAGTAIFVDVRGAEVYAMSHIPGSLSIPLAEIETRLNELDPKQWIIPYCT